MPNVPIRTEQQVEHLLFVVKTPLPPYNVEFGYSIGLDCDMTDLPNLPNLDVLHRLLQVIGASWGEIQGGHSGLLVPLKLPQKPLRQCRLGQARHRQGPRLTERARDRGDRGCVHHARRSARPRSGSNQRLVWRLDNLQSMRSYLHTRVGRPLLI